MTVHAAVYRLGLVCLEMFYSRGISGTAHPNGRTAARDASGGKYLQENCKSYPERTYTNIVINVEMEWNHDVVLQ